MQAVPQACAERNEEDGVSDNSKIEWARAAEAAHNYQQGA